MYCCGVFKLPQSSVRKGTFINTVSKALKVHSLSSHEENTKSSRDINSEKLDSNLKKRIFNTVLWRTDDECNFVIWAKKLREESKAKLRSYELEGVKSTRPLTVRLLDEYKESQQPEISQDTVHTEEDTLPQYPYAENIGYTHDTKISRTRGKSRRVHTERELTANKIKKLERMKQWMSDYELYDENSVVNGTDHVVPFGTSDPSKPVSQVPCGGCGALLHCQDHSIPGYLPVELFGSLSKRNLKSIICQRCHFLKEFNVALDVRVTPKEYSQVISCIKEKRAIAVLMVDLLDFPCSIWPDIMEIIGTARPVIIVGNKVDLLPGDHKGYLNHIKETLQLYVEKMGVAKANIKHISLISARTGFGVEDLITHLHSLWDFKCDVYLLGCTNVGKSSLFNMLLQSDFCKTQASALVQRATTSVWPGTTLNLLKFPILRPEGWRLTLRRKRLFSERAMHKNENELRLQQFNRNQMYHLPSLFNYVGQTFIPLVDTKDMYSLSKESAKRIGIDEKDFEFVQGRWCYDTPGVMHPDQILDILTTEELMKVIPKKVIVPRFFCLTPGRSLFLGGLGRIDYVSASPNKSTRLAVFSSECLPVTIARTEEADDVYKTLLGTELMAVPFGGSNRLAAWPGIHAQDEIIKVEGQGWNECCADIILSSAGWIAISGQKDMDMTFRAWTPFSRGIHLRQPALLPFSVTFRGKRIGGTPTYYNKRAGGKASLELEDEEPQNHENF